MKQKVQNRIKFLVALLVIQFSSIAQTVGSCPNGFIYFETSPIQAYNPTLPLSPTNPVSTGIPAGGSGLAYGPNVVAPLPNLTFYANQGGTVAGNIAWWNGTFWVNTGHSFPAVNIAAGGGFVYGLNGGTGQVYRYNGTGPSVLILTVPGFAGGGPYDLVADCNGNWSIIRTLNPQWMRTYDSNGNLLCTYTLTGMPSTSGGVGFALVNNVVYVKNGLGFFTGPITGTVVNFSQSVANPAVGGDIASCPDCPPTPTLPAVASTSGSLSCGIQSVNVIATTTVSPVSYSWTGPSPTSIIGLGSNSVAAVNTPGVYSCTITSAGCPPISTVVTTTVSGAGGTIIPTFVVSNAITCTNSTASITANPGPPGYTYTWTGPGITNTNNNIVTVNQAGIYTLAIAEATSSCSGSQTVAVQINTVSPQLSVQQSSTVVCSGASVSLSVTGASSYTWVNATPQNNSTLNVTPFVTTTYSVSGSFTNGCTSNANITVNVISPSINVTPFYTVCQGTNLQLNATNTVSALFSWSGPNNFASTLQNPLINNINPIYNGNFTLTAFFTAPNSTLVACTSSAVSNVSVVPANPVTPFSSANVCQYATGNFSASAIGSAAYQWFGPNGFNSNNQINTITNIQPASGGNYTVNAIFTIGTVSCTTTNFIPLNVIPVPSVAVIQSITVCDSQSASFAASAPNAISYIWSGPNSFNTNSPNPIFVNLTPSMSGMYTVTAGFSNGNLTCYNSNQTNLLVKPILPFNLGADKFLCPNSNLVLNGPAGATQYNWSGTSSYTSNTQSLFLPSLGPQNSGIYVLEVDLNGCKTYDSVRVDVLTPIIFTLTPSNRTVCRGENVNFVVGAAQGSENYAYTWSPVIYITGPTGSVQAGQPLGTTIYNISAYDITCPNNVIQTSFTVTVKQPPQPNISLPKNNACEPLCGIYNSHLRSEASSVTYDFGNNRIYEGDSINVCLPAGTHYMRIIANGKNGCKGTYDYTVPITVYPKPGADFTWDPEQPTTENNIVTFNPTTKNGTVFAYNWAFTNSPNNGGIDASIMKNPTHIYDNNGKFLVSLLVNNEYGCIDSIFKVIFIDEDLAVYIPNAFTPNDDNINDVFNVKGVGLKAEGYYMQIFDRWGTLVYATKDINNGWDGTVKGQKAADGVYTYTLRVFKNNSAVKKEFQGHVNLLK